MDGNLDRNGLPLRPGMRAWGLLMGPVGPAAGAIVLAVAAVAGVVVGRRTRRRKGLGWSVAMGALSFDLAGGLLAFQLPATRELHARHAPGARLRFVAGHLHPFLLPLSGQGGWTRAVGRYATAVAATVALDRCPDSRRRRGLALTLSLTLAGADFLTDRSPQRWFGPVYLVKLVGGHASTGATPRHPPTQERTRA